jgi:hypothetical protein
MAGATRLITGASSTSLDGDVCFPGKFSIMASAFVLGQVLNIGSLAYVADCYGELHLLHGAAMTSNEPSVSSPPLGPSRAYLEVLAQQIWHSLGSDPTVLDHC